MAEARSSPEFRAKEQVEVKIEDSHISELIIMKNGKDPPIKIREITGWYRIEIKKI